jgi:hypothetical protein
LADRLVGSGRARGVDHPLEAGEPGARESRTGPEGLVRVKDVSPQQEFPSREGSGRGRGTVDTNVDLPQRWR